MLANQSFIRMALVTGLALSIGWGIRGNFGHEYGAMIPGALAALAAVLVSGRADWHSRVASFAFFGALGWSFGGSISYMQVIAYTHSGHSPSVLYGFASLFVIGFLWGAPGGAGTAMPVFLDRTKLADYFPAIVTVFGAWVMQDLVVDNLIHQDSNFRQASPLYWNDTDWLSATVAIGAILVLVAFRRKCDAGSSLVLHMAIGWWIGFYGLVEILGLRMTPPRGDNWAGCVGMTMGMFLYFLRNGLVGIAWAGMLSGLVGGFGFAGATLFKLLGMTSGWQTNWHSVLEQTYGLLNGFGIAAVMWMLARRAPVVADIPSFSHWSGAFSVFFVLFGITYVNLVKNVGTWVKAKAMPETMGGLTPLAWFNLAYITLLGLGVTLWLAHRRRPLAFVPTNWLGRGQLMLLVLLWWIVIGNFGRALVGFSPQRLITEGVIHFNAVILSAWVVLLAATAEPIEPSATVPDYRSWLRRTAVFGLVVSVLLIGLEWGTLRAVYGDRFAGHASLHIRFGSKATATKQKPDPSKPHP